MRGKGLMMERREEGIQEKPDVVYMYTQHT